jgi:hypothetical protein
MTRPLKRQHSPRENFPQAYKKQVEAARARLRQSELNGKSLLPENFPEALKGDSRDKAAQEVGNYKRQFVYLPPGDKVGPRIRTS